jgi:hypothetical protein
VHHKATTSAVSDYLKSRNDEYSGDDYTVKLVEVTRYEVTDDGILISHTETLTFVVKVNK